MSIKVSAMVWERGPDNASEMLVLLALADFANDIGECWPSVPTIARKSRLSERGVRKCLRRLVDSGWLSIEQGGGGFGANRYKVCPPEHDSPLNEVPPCTQFPTPLNTVPKPPEHGSAKPLRTVIEPSVCEGGTPSPAPAPRADEVKQAFDAWNEVAVQHGLVQAKALNPKRRQAIKARLKEAGGVNVWKDTLATIPDSPFLMGQTQHAFRMDLDFALRPSSFMRLVEGKYHDGKPSQPLQAEQIEAQRQRRQRLVEMGVINA